MNEQEVKDLEAKAMKSQTLISEIIEIEKDIYLLEMYSKVDGEISAGNDMNACPKKIVLRGSTKDRANTREIEVGSYYWMQMVCRILTDKKAELDNKRRQLDEMFVKNIYGVEPKQTKED